MTAATSPSAAAAPLSGDPLPHRSPLSALAQEATPAAPLQAGVHTLGVLGGGQLGRMFVHAAQAMGYRTAVLDDDPTSPAGQVSHHHVRTPYLDDAGLAELATLCAAVTTEFENVPAAALERLARSLPVAPAAGAVRICQDRALEKSHFERSGVRCAPWVRIESASDADAADPALFPAILKTTRLGYDGKGQLAVPDAAALPAAWAALNHMSCVLERRLALALEVSVVVARGADGTMVHLPLQQNLHADGILALTEVPAPGLSAALAAQAVDSAYALAAGMGYVGVLCVEFFVLADGSLVANEMAPRPHNSGHHSIDSCDLSQFALQVRTMAGLPLVPPRQHSPALMLNLLGDLWWPVAAGVPARPQEPDWPAVLALPGTHLHLYGKTDPRPGRKMGHLTITAATAEAARSVGRRASALLGLPPERIGG